MFRSDNKQSLTVVKGYDVGFLCVAIGKHKQTSYVAVLDGGNLQKKKKKEKEPKQKLLDKVNSSCNKQLFVI